MAEGDGAAAPLPPGEKRRRVTVSRRAVVGQLWRAAKRQLDAHEEHLADLPQGTAASETDAKALATLARTGLMPYTRLLGFQPPEVLGREAYAHHLFLAPSVTAADGDTEGGAPVVLIEMVASGMPAVATRHCDIPHVLPAKWHGLLAPERDAAALAAAIEDWIAAPAPVWAERLAAGRTHLERGFDAASQGRALARIYREIRAA